MDLGLPTQIIGAPIARDGRWTGVVLPYWLSRRTRTALRGNLNKVLKDVIARAGETGDLRDAEIFGCETLKAVGFDSVDYVAIRDAETLAVTASRDRPARVLAAAKIGRTPA